MAVMEVVISSKVEVATINKRSAKFGSAEACRTMLVSIGAGSVLKVALKWILKSQH
jgi:hypothetical protein